MLQFLPVLLDIFARFLHQLLLLLVLPTRMLLPSLQLRPLLPLGSLLLPLLPRLFLQPHSLCFSWLCFFDSLLKI